MKSISLEKKNEAIKAAEAYNLLVAQTEKLISEQFPEHLKYPLLNFMKLFSETNRIVYKIELEKLELTNHQVLILFKPRVPGARNSCIVADQEFILSNQLGNVPNLKTLWLTPNTLVIRLTS